MTTKVLRDALPSVGLLYSATLWGVLWYPLRLLDHAGMHGLWATAIMFSAAFIAGVGFAVPHARAALLQPWPLLGMALANGWCNVAFILAVLDGNVVRVTLLFFLSPLWATLLACVFLGERVSMRAWIVLAFALAGALIMLWDPHVGYPWPQDAADWMALSSGVAFALSNVFVRQASSVPLALKTATAWWGVVVTAALWIALADAPLPQVTSGAWMGAIALGLGAILTMTIAVQYGVTHMPVHRSSVILLFELVASAVSSQWLTEEVVQTREWVGGALITLAAYVSARWQMEKHGEN